MRDKERVRARVRDMYRYARSLGLSSLEANALKGQSREHIRDIVASGDTSRFDRARVSVNRYSAGYRMRNIYKKNAKEQVSHHIATGRMVREPCLVCGDPQSQGHHADYGKPLEVTWLCDTHHKEEHRRLKETPQP